ncbi:hypothetical protein GIB67_017965 [Kingdonia uniflora]|uniref:Uncharacterized protein n=1 Tax=Kingdonia uniflora TaxID=39325 RepID=A0A7J7MI52_9MAGN|nr:hypothetical protein GIB67_017965 [Kingdonia uniflora]
MTKSVWEKCLDDILFIFDILEKYSNIVVDESLELKEYETDKGADLKEAPSDFSGDFKASLCSSKESDYTVSAAINDDKGVVLEVDVFNERMQKAGHICQNVYYAKSGDSRNCDIMVDALQSHVNDLVEEKQNTFTVSDALKFLEDEIKKNNQLIRTEAAAFVLIICGFDGEERLISVFQYAFLQVKVVFAPNFAITGSGRNHAYSLLERKIWKDISLDRAENVCNEIIKFCFLRDKSTGPFAYELLIEREILLFPLCLKTLQVQSFFLFFGDHERLIHEALFR